MRAFVAVEITDPGIINGISEVQRRLVPADSLRNVRLVNAKMLHFTLQFLGEIPDDAWGPVADALSTVRFARFDMDVGGVGAFPDARSPRAVWVGGGGAAGVGAKGDGESPLQALAQKVAAALRPLGYARDKPFRPHSTIFRVKRRDPEVASRVQNASCETFGVQGVDSFKLKKSRLTPDGPIYEDLAVIGSERGGGGGRGRGADCNGGDGGGGRGDDSSMKSPQAVGAPQ